MEHKLSPQTLCVQGGWQPKNGESRVLPIYQSTTFKYDTTEQMARLFDLEEAGFFYTRLQNPTTEAVAAKIAALEGGIAALATASGSAAITYAVKNIARAGDHIVAASTLYGGTYNLFAHTLPEDNITTTFVDPDTVQNFEDAIPNFAKINSIKATWAGENDRVKSALERLKNIFSEESRSGASSDFLFVINDSKTYTSLQDFKDAKAKGYASQWAEALKIYDSQKAQLDSEREVYSTADTEKRNSLKPQILAKEKEVEKLKASIKNLEKQISEEELKKQ